MFVAVIASKNIVITFVNRQRERKRGEKPGIFEFTEGGQKGTAQERSRRENANPLPANQKEGKWKKRKKRPDLYPARYQKIEIRRRATPEREKKKAAICLLHAEGKKGGRDDILCRGKKIKVLARPAGGVRKERKRSPSLIRPRRSRKGKKKEGEMSVILVQRRAKR